MKTMLTWTALRINRRRVLATASAGAFGALASAAVGHPAYAGSCTGPFGTGYCGSALCGGPNCRNSGPYRCHKILGFCGSSACWTSGSHTCCDCRCHEGPSADGWYCYCHG